MSGGIQVLRAETRSQVRGALAAHVAARLRPATAVPATGERANSVLLDQVERAARYARRFPRTGPRGGRPAKPAVDFVVAGPPRFGAPERWGRAREDAYFRDAYSWLVEKMGSRSMVACAAIHRDETAPHLHVLAVPVSSRGLGWNPVLNER